MYDAEKELRALCAVAKLLIDVNEVYYKGALWTAISVFGDARGFLKIAYSQHLFSPDAWKEALEKTKQYLEKQDNEDR